MLDFREKLDNGQPSGKIKKAFYKYISAHPNDPTVIKIKKLAKGESLAQGYRRYLEELESSENSKIFEQSTVQQEFDYETGESFSSKVLDASKELSEEELLKQHGYSVENWKITKHQCSKWNSGDNVLMSSKIFVKPRNILESSPESLLKRIDKALDFKVEDLGFSQKDLDALENTEKLLVIPIADLHYGLIADAETAGNVYNMEIAEDRLQRFVATSLAKFNTSKGVGSVLVTFGNDYFNCDNPAGTTAHGTPQDNEAAYLTTWDRGVRLAVTIIDYIQKNISAASKVYVAGVQGNHDLQSSHALLLALKYKYLDSKQIIVDATSDEFPRYYFAFGDNLLGFGHGTKITDCHRLMSSEADAEWGKRRYKTMLLAHLHQEEVLDTGALVVRRLPTLSGNSIWASSKGFVPSPRGQSFIFDSTAGLTDMFNIEM